MNKTMYRGSLALGAVALAALLSACGGGGADAGKSPFNTNSGTTTETAASVNELRLSLSSTAVSNATSTPVTATATAVGASGQTLSGVEVAYVVSGGLTYTRSTTVTDANGKNAASIDLNDDRSNRTITVTATAGGKSVSKTFTITGSRIDSATSPSLVEPGAAGKVTFTVLDANGSPQANVPVVIHLNDVQVQSTTSDNFGVAEYAYTAPSTPGASFTVKAYAAGVNKSETLQVKTPAQVIAVPDLTGVTPSLQVDKTVVQTNAVGSTSNRIQLITTFKKNGVPVQNVRVVYRLAGFTAVGGQFQTGSTGTLTTGTPVAYSSTDGRAVDYYIPAQTQSPNGQVFLQACYGDTDAAAQACDSSRLLQQEVTVASDPVSVTIGTDNLIEDDSANLSYVQRYVIQVTNSAGQPMSGVTVTPVINTVNYHKGFFTYVSSTWVNSADFECAKEDLNDDDTRQAGEDIDHDETLEPVRANITFAPNVQNVNTTDSTGRVIFKMSYPKDKAYWNVVKIDATAITSGSEGRAKRTVRLGYLAADAKKEGEPAFVRSEYGTVTSNVTLSAARTMPDGTVIPSGTTLTPCQNPD